MLFLKICFLSKNQRTGGQNWGTGRGDGEGKGERGREKAGTSGRREEVGKGCGRMNMG
jgi:hypothetical protein